MAHKSAWPCATKAILFLREDELITSEKMLHLELLDLGLSVQLSCAMHGNQTANLHYSRPHAFDTCLVCVVLRTNTKLA